MSRNLPPHPNLDYLKKQAKELLRELKQQNPASKLADAQFALAREYGFASWPKLKTYIESLPNAGTSSVVTQDQENPFIGKWKANLSKSRRHPANQFQSSILEFSVIGNTVTISDTVVDESGHEVRGENTILVDGNERPSDNGYVLMAQWRGSRVFETMAKKDGVEVGWGRYEVSEDANTLTISGDQQAIVLDRA